MLKLVSRCTQLSRDCIPCVTTGAIVLLNPYVVISYIRSKKISNDQELIQSDPISCPQNHKGNN